MERLLYVLVRLFESIVYYMLLNRVLQKRFESRMHWWALLACMISMNAANCLLANGAYNLDFITSIAGDLLVAHLFYRGRISRTALHTAFFYGMMFVCDLFGYFAGTLVGAINVGPIASFEHIPEYIALLSRLPLPGFAWLYLKCIKHKVSTDVQQGKITLIPIIFCVLIIAFNPWGTDKNLYHKSPLLFYLVCILIVIAAALLILLLIGQAVREARYKERLKHLGYQEQYYNNLGEESKRLRGIYHDFANILDYLEASGSPGKHINHARSRLERPSIQTGNRDVDTILYAKSNAFRDKGISLRVSGYLHADTSWLDAIDLCIILGNALDNAAEATITLGPSQRKPVEVHLAQKGKMLLIEVINPALTNGGIDFRSTKKAVGHGHGINNIQKAVSRYNGHMEITAKCGYVALSVILQEPINNFGGQANE